MFAPSKVFLSLLCPTKPFLPHSKKFSALVMLLSLRGENFRLKTSLYELLVIN